METHPPAIDPALAALVPADTVLLAGVDLDRLRASPLYAQLPRAAVGIFEPVRQASSALVASNGTDLLIMARGTFREAPPGATLVAPGVAVLGAPASIRAATRKHQFPALLARAAEVARGKPVWIVAQGSATLPLAGNAANLNRLLHFTDYATLTAALGARVEVEFTGVCRTPDAARQLEETIRAMISMAQAGAGRRHDIAALLGSIQLRREDLTVHAALAAGADQLKALTQ